MNDKVQVCPCIGAITQCAHASTATSTVKTTKQRTCVCTRILLNCPCVYARNHAYLWSLCSATTQVSTGMILISGITAVSSLNTHVNSLYSNVLLAGDLNARVGTCSQPWVSGLGREIPMQLQMLTPLILSMPMVASYCSCMKKSPWCFAFAELSWMRQRSPASRHAATLSLLALIMSLWMLSFSMPFNSMPFGLTGQICEVYSSSIAVRPQACRLCLLSSSVASHTFASCLEVGLSLGRLLGLAITVMPILDCW